MGTSCLDPLVDCGTWTQSRSAFSNVIQCPETRLERKPNTETSTNNGPGTFVRHRIIFDRSATASVNRGGGRVNDRETSAFCARLPRANNVPTTVPTYKSIPSFLLFFIASNFERILFAPSRDRVILYFFFFFKEK